MNIINYMKLSDTTTTTTTKLCVEELAVTKKYSEKIKQKRIFSRNDESIQS